jgi:uncharacterized repeat protein (TIGR03806 family)
MHLQARSFLAPCLAIAAMVAACSDRSRSERAAGSILAEGPDVLLPQAIGPYLNGAFPDRAPSPGDLDLIDAFPQLSWVDPIDFKPEPRSTKLWIAEIAGRIWAVDNDRAATQRTAVLDIRSRVFRNDRGGLLGFAFHPDWGNAGSPNRGYVYVWYQWAPGNVQVDDQMPWSWAHYRRLSRFRRLDGQTSCDPASEQILIQQYAPSLLHAGGGLFFGLDRFLYLSIGDDGRFWDYEDHTQRLDRGLFSGILRIDVDRDPTRSHAIRRQPVDFHQIPPGWPASSTANYFVPDDNPWLDPVGTRLEEFWAIGLRSPHRMSQDPATGDVWLGDVGQNTREELSLARKGDNLQWPFMEGTFPLYDRPSVVIGNEVGPVWDYGRMLGNCAVGGHVYRGSALPELQGLHLFADNVQGKLFSVSRQGFAQVLMNVPGNTSEFYGTSCLGVDHAGELFVCRWNGPRNSGAKVFMLVRKGSASREPPARLSDVRAFADLATLTPVHGLQPYEINAPFWSDDAHKTRWIALPNDGAHDTAAKRIGFSEAGAWTFPPGTVLVKHFELPLDFTRPDPPRRRLETRFLVRDAQQGWYGVTYRWRADGSDADLLGAAASEQITVQTSGGPEVRTWDYPGRSQCLQCHNANAGFALGIKTSQLHRSMAHPTTGAAANQLAIWNSLGMFEPALDETRLPALPALVAIDDTSAALEHRVRSYFDANCAYCHRPGGVFGALFDARLSTAAAQQGIVDGPLYDERGTPGARVIAPGDVSKSLAFTRIASVDPSLRMPPIGKNHADANALIALQTWIAQVGGVADFGAAVHMGPPGLQVAFQDTSTVAGTAWRWDFGDGATSTAQNPSHVYTQPGRYDVTLEVTAPGGPYRAHRAGWVVVGANVARAGSAQQSSTWAGGVAPRAIDGNTDGNPANGSVSETDVENTPWWQVDLGSVQQLYAIRIWNRSGFGAEWLSQFVVFLSDVPFASTDVTQTRSQPGVTAIDVGPMVVGSLQMPLDRSARYVRIQSLLWGVISLAEVELFGAPLAAAVINVARGKAATQSSTKASSFDLKAANAVDGNIAGSEASGSLASTGFDQDAWWEVDLGARQAIERIVLWNRTDCCSERLAGFRVLVSDVPFGGAALLDALATPGVWHHRHDGFAARRTEVAVGRTGRYVRVQLEGREHLQLAEVEVFARATASPGSVTLGNRSSFALWQDHWASNLVIDESDVWTNTSGSAQSLRVERFGFRSRRIGGPVTPFLARVDGQDQFTVLAIGSPRTAYRSGDNAFAFDDAGAPVVALQPGERVVAGFLDALPDGTGGEAGSAVSFDVARFPDEVWITGGRSGADAGRISVGQPPFAGTQTLTTLRRSYHFRVELVRL